MLTEINVHDAAGLSAWLKGRQQAASPEVMASVADILGTVQKEGDKALFEYSEKFDGIRPESLAISKEQLEEEAQKADPQFVHALKLAADNIRSFHEHQIQEGYLIHQDEDVWLGQKVLPIDSAGLYIPGGRAQYPSSVLMNAIPAKVAGVRRVVMVTPPSRNGLINPNIAAAALVAGVDEVYAVGGAQAVGALAYGTKSIEPVDKIVGPGNVFVATAKRLVYGTVDIDMIAGPSEILVIADEKANPRYVAADLISQAEHDPMACAILISTSADLIEKVNEQLKEQSAKLPRKNIIEASLRDYGKSILVDSLDQALEIANAIAPEHLELQTENAKELLDGVRNAGSIFVGEYSCESVGDYFGGCNHVLPTSGTARFSSALGVDAFLKRSCFLHYSAQALNRNGDHIVCLANEEDLQGHANAVLIRKENGYGL